MAWHGMAWHGMAWHGMAWHGMAWQPTCPDALLAVACTLELAHVTVWVNCAQEHRLELVHASIGEQQGGVVQRHLHAAATGAAAWSF
jgi:hypothetical protein